MIVPPRSPGFRQHALWAMAMLFCGLGAGCDDLRPVDDNLVVLCTDASECPDGAQCLAEVGRCHRVGDPCVEEQGGSLAPSENGTRCTRADDSAGICMDAQCSESVCGDGLLDGVVAQEACDDGQSNTDAPVLVANTACRSNCQVGRCGDGIQDGDEACDDGNTVDDDGCSNECTSNCGDGRQQAGEDCDDGNLISGDGCDANCTITACGNGVLTVDEICDDGTHCSNGSACQSDFDCRGKGDEVCIQRPNDGCENNCQITGCGDGVKAANEECDDGNLDNGDACDRNCTLPRCGNGEVGPGELCDDGNGLNGDACPDGADGTCFPAECGDGFVQVGVEACDDGNSDNDDGCLNTCMPSTCGDGFHDPATEECDDGNAVETDDCLSSCVHNVCGDGVQNIGTEACDDGRHCEDGTACQEDAECAGIGDALCVQRGTDACTADCVFNVCGDGLLFAAAEACDDGDLDQSNACLNDCSINVCGDGFTLVGVEACDDGNTVEQDDCRSTCELNVCGDGVQNIGVEACDDGNADGNDGCLDCQRTQWSATLWTGTGASSGDPAQISVVRPAGVDVAANGDVVFVDSLQGLVFRIDAQSGIVQKVAGGGSGGLSAGTEIDGTRATDLDLFNPVGVAVGPDGTVYVSQPAFHRVIRIEPNGIAYRHAGDDAACGGGACGDGSAAVGAQLNGPRGLDLDGVGNLYIADYGSGRVRRVSPDGVIGKWVDCGSGGILCLQGLEPGGGVVDLGQVNAPEDVAAYGENRLLVASGGGLFDVYSNTSAAELVARGSNVMAVDHTDTVGIIYASNGDPNQLFALSGGGTAQLFAGSASGSPPHPLGADDVPARDLRLGRVSSIAISPSGNVIFGEEEALRIRTVFQGQINTLAGNGLVRLAGDGFSALQASMEGPASMLGFGSEVWITDATAGRVRSLSAAGIVDGAVGIGEGCVYNRDPLSLDPAVDTCNPAGGLDFMQLGPLGQIAPFGANTALLADIDGQRIWKLHLVADFSERVAGTGYEDNGSASPDNVSATTVELAGPYGVTADNAGNFYFSEMFAHVVRKVDAAGVITSFAGTRGILAANKADVVREASCAVPVFPDLPDGTTCTYLNSPQELFWGSDDALYIADVGNHAIRRVHDELGAWNSENLTKVQGDGTLGKACSAFNGDGPMLASTANLCAPAGMAEGPDGSLYVADPGHHRIRRIYWDAGQGDYMLETFIGHDAGCGANGNIGGDGGLASEACVRNPRGLFVDGGGMLYITDTSTRLGGVVRRVDLLDPQSTIERVAGAYNPGEGPLLSARLLEPHGLAWPTVAGGVLVAEGQSGRLRRVTPPSSGEVRTAIGEPAAAPSVYRMDVAAPATRFFGHASGIAQSRQGDRIFMTDRNRGEIVEIKQVDPADPASWTLERLSHKTPSELPGGGMMTCVGGSPTGAWLQIQCAEFGAPSGIAHNPNDPADPLDDTVFVSDHSRHVVYEFDFSPTTQRMRIVAGIPANAGSFYGDGLLGTQSRLNTPTGLALGPMGDLYIADSENHRVRRWDPVLETLHVIHGIGLAASIGEGSPARLLPVELPTALAVDQAGNLFIAGASTVRVILAGADQMADGDDSVITIYGDEENPTFPEGQTRCITGIAFAPASECNGEVDGCLLIADQCLGYLVQLTRQVQ
jgi:cysteine-rich repeat protein